VKVLAKVLPLTHAVNISRAVFSGNPSPGLAGGFLYLVLLEVVAFYCGIKLMKRRLIK
jgi:ABC-type multidrug transport system permease subunit